MSHPTTAPPSTEPLRGLALLDAVIAKIESDREHWEQGSWHEETPCGTAYCVAGWAVVLGTGITADQWIDEDGEIGTQWAELVDIDGYGPQFVSGAARELLDIQDTWGLFSGGNSLDDIRRIRDRIADEKEAIAAEKPEQPVA